MGLPFDCHFILKWQPDRVSSDSHFILKWQPDDILIRLYFFWNVNWMEVPSGSHFFVHVNRIVVVVELKFCIEVQEECIRVQEEFVHLELLYIYWVQIASWGISICTPVVWSCSSMGLVRCLVCSYLLLLIFFFLLYQPLSSQDLSIHSYFFFVHFLEKLKNINDLRFDRVLLRSELCNKKSPFDHSRCARRFPIIHLLRKKTWRCKKQLLYWANKIWAIL